MQKNNNLLHDIVKDPGSYLMLLVLVVVVVASVFVIATSGAESLRYMYCTANEAQAIECALKGW